MYICMYDIYVYLLAKEVACILPLSALLFLRWGLSIENVLGCA